MPRNATRNKLLEFSLFISLLALVGHFTVNYWERFVIQKEISRTKASLHSLRDTLDDIGDAYTHLYKEIRLITKQVEQTDPVIDEGFEKLMGHNPKVVKQIEGNPDKTETGAYNSNEIVHPDSNIDTNIVHQNIKNESKKYERKDADTQVYLMTSTAQQTSKNTNKRNKSSSSRKPPIKRYCTNDPHDSAHYCYAKV